MAMRQATLKAAIFVLISLPSHAAQAVSYDYTSIFLSASNYSTIALGINNANTVVGNYYDSVGYHGFTDAGGVVTTIEDPLAMPGKTWASGINDAGAVTGFYLDASGEAHGFVAISGSFTDVNVPSVGGGTALGINNAGEISGFYGDQAGVHGFLDQAGTFITLNVPAAGGRDTYAYGISNSGLVTGSYIPAGSVQLSEYLGFVYKNGVFTTIDDPLASPNHTTAYGINASGTVVGSYVVLGDGQHGFIEQGGNYVTIDFLGAAYTQVNGINDNGVIVGQYLTTDGVFRGFIGIPTTDVTVPEPAAWTLMLAGLASIAAFARGFRRHPPA